ncbi:hypothetical protein ABTM19_21465, partial [Acinetobacter baumannii]
IPAGYVDLAASGREGGRFERALSGEAQPRPEPLRPELGRSASAPAAPVRTAPSVAATVEPRFVQATAHSSTGSATVA